MKIKLERNRTHQKYEVNGVYVPGVTTILQEMSKPFLLTWANKQGLAGIDINKDREALDIGTIAHFLIDCHLNGNEPDLEDYAPVDVKKAQTAFSAYLELEKKHGIKPIKNELQLISKVYGYGGTLDLYCEIDGKKTLVDFKTSKAIYKEYHLQLSAYSGLLIENDMPIEQYYIFRIDKETGDFEDKKVVLTGKEFTLFLKYLEIYMLRKELKI
jgi:hypothetical protein